MTDPGDGPASDERADPGGRRPGGRRIRRMSLFLLRFAVLFVILFPMFAAVANIYRPRKRVDLDPRTVGAVCRELEARTSDGLTLKGWYLESAVQPALGAVLALHGVGANRVDMLDRALFLRDAGYSCALFDWRAHGESDGRKVSYGIHETKDMVAFLDALELEAPGLPVGVLAQSMGAAVVIQAAELTPRVLAYVLDSPFATLWEMARENWRDVPDFVGIPLQHTVGFWGSLVIGRSIMDISPQDELVGLEPRPVLFIHGMSDTFIPVEHTVRLHGLYRGPKDLLLVEGAGHVGSYATRPEEYSARVLGHFGRHLVRTMTPGESPAIPAEGR